MALAVANPMATKKDGPYCTYSSVKIDSDLIKPLKLAAVQNDRSIQEFLSDLVNSALSGKKDGHVIVRKQSPPPKKRG